MNKQISPCVMQRGGSGTEGNKLRNARRAGGKLGRPKKTAAKTASGHCHGAWLDGGRAGKLFLIPSASVSAGGWICVLRPRDVPVGGTSTREQMPLY